MGYFSGKVVLVTGAGAGLGRELAKELAGQGAFLGVIDLNPDSLDSLREELKETPFATAMGDVTDRTGLFSAVADIRKQLGPIDVLIANAGIGIETSALDFHAADIEAQIKVNLLGVANSIEAVLPEMIQRKSGHLVAISSLASYRGLPKMLGYCASKAGVSSLMDGLRYELSPLGIAVTTICPGWIRTSLTDKVHFPKPGMMELPYARDRILRAISRRRPYIAFPFGPAWQVRTLRWLPCRVSDWLLRIMLKAMGQS